jgi:hypothetical protein
MQKIESKALIAKLEAGEPFGHRDKAVLEDAIDALSSGGSVWPEARPDKTESADEALYVVEELFPDWDISLKGGTSATHGHWVCTIRKSAARDDDEAIGVGKSPVLAHAIFAACLKLVEQKHHL